MAKHSTSRPVRGDAEPLLVGEGCHLSSGTGAGGLSLLSCDLTCLLLKPPIP